MLLANAGETGEVSEWANFEFLRNHLGYVEFLQNLGYLHYA